MTLYGGVVDESTKKNLKSLVQVSSVGIGMAVAIFGSAFVGYLLDRYFTTTPLLSIVFLLLGVAAGFRNFFRLVKRYGIDTSPLNRDKKNDNAPHGNKN
jgi:ATP synthase protein I